jgi:hypothetical protein
MKVLSNAAMMFGAVALMGWLLISQAAYQRSFSDNPSIQSNTTQDTSLATSANRAMLALK